MAEPGYMDVTSIRAVIAGGPSGLGESFTTALWTSIFCYYFDPTKNDQNQQGGYMLNHEFYDHSLGGFADMVLLHSVIPPGWNAAYHIPFFDMEAKKTGGRLQEAFDQLRKGMAGIQAAWILQRGMSNRIFGAVVAGLNVQFYENVVVQNKSPAIVDPVINGVNFGGLTNLGTVAGRTKVEDFLIAVRNDHEAWLVNTFPGCLAWAVANGRL